MGDIRRPGRNPRQGVTAKVIKRKTGPPARGGGPLEPGSGLKPGRRKLPRGAQKR